MKNRVFKICSDKLLWRDIDKEVIILDIDNDNYYSLNETGSLVWKMIEKKKNIADITSAVSKEYAISEKKAEKDISEIIDKLKKAKLIVTA